MKLTFFILLLLSGCATSPEYHDEKTISIFHFNIKELTTDKIASTNDPQMDAVKKIFDEQDFDILSLNEIQYDLPGVPDLNYKTQGENFTKFLKTIGFEPSEWSQIFSPANTGAKAKRQPHGAYHTYETTQARADADQINYGIFPAQYSTAGAVKGKIHNQEIITDLKWIDFNPKANPSQFDAGNSQPLPKEMRLFDKNFNHAITEFYGKKLHVIFLHTVPSYHFGNKNTPNYARNQDQLRFLEWYVTGTTDIKTPLNRSNYPAIASEDGVIVVGDLNVDINSTNSGAKTLNRLISKMKMWMQNPPHTNEGSGFEAKPFSLLLDYILVSKNLEVIDGGVIRPTSEFKEIGCDHRANLIKAPAEMVKVTMKNNCYALVHQDYYLYKIASDHFPLYATVRFVDSK